MDTYEIVIYLFFFYFCSRIFVGQTYQNYQKLVFSSGQRAKVIKLKII
jgi:hypothetical protein